MIVDHDRNLLEYILFLYLTGLLLYLLSAFVGGYTVCDSTHYLVPSLLLFPLVVQTRGWCHKVQYQFIA